MSGRLRPSYDDAGGGQLLERIRRRAVPGTVVSRRFRLLNEDDRESPAMTDPGYLPAWLYLGMALRPRRIVEYGCGLGLASGSVALGCSPAWVLSIQDDAAEEYNWRLAQNNLKDCFDGTAVLHTGPFDGPDFQEDLQAGVWDMAIVNEPGGKSERLLYVMRCLHSRLAPGGVLAVEYAGDRGSPAAAFDEFCKSRSLEPLVLPTRYGIGLATAG